MEITEEKKQSDFDALAKHDYWGFKNMHPELFENDGEGRYIQ